MRNRPDTLEQTLDSFSEDCSSPNSPADSFSTLEIFPQFLFYINIVLQIICTCINLVLRAPACSQYQHLAGHLKNKQKMTSFENLDVGVAVL